MNSNSFPEMPNRDLYSPMVFAKKIYRHYSILLFISQALFPLYPTGAYEPSETDPELQSKYVNVYELATGLKKRVKIKMVIPTPISAPTL